MLKIEREFCGTKIEIELTYDEAKKAYKEIQHIKDFDDVSVVLSDLALDNNEDYVEKITDEYRRIQDDMTMGDGFFRDCVFKAVAENPPPQQKKKYNVRVQCVYCADIEVEAKNEREAEQIALERERDADYYPIMGTVEVDDVWED